MRITTSFLRLFSFLILLSVSSSLLVQASPLMPQDIIDLHQSGKSQELIIKEIQDKSIGFQVNLPVLERFIEAGLSQGVLEVLLGNDPQRLSTSQNAIRFQRPARAGIAVITNPPGLRVTINGKDHGFTPSLSNKMKPGKYIVKVSHPLYFPRTEEVEFDGTDDVVLNWDMDPREPVIRLSVNIERGKNNEPWSWVAKPRKQCPGCEVSGVLKPWKKTAETGEAVFLLSDEAKRLFRGSFTGCLELNIWKGEVRRDLPLRNLPPPAAKYYLTAIEIDGIVTVEIQIDIKVRELNPTEPEVVMKGDSGYLIEAELSPETQKNKKSYEEMIETLDGIAE